MNDRNKPCNCGSGLKSKKCCNKPTNGKPENIGYPYYIVFVATTEELKKGVGKPVMTGKQEIIVFKSRDDSKQFCEEKITLELNEFYACKGLSWNEWIDFRKKNKYRIMGE